MLVNNQHPSHHQHASASASAASGMQPPAGRPQMPAIVSKLNLVLHISAASVAISVAFALFDSTLFGWHPLFMSFGFLLFMTEGLIGAVMFRHLDGPERVNAIWSHALMQVRALICILIGFVVIYQNKVLHGKKHFQTRHAQCGLAAVLLSVASPLLGLISFKRLGIIHRFPESWHPRLKWMHRKAGVFTWLLALITVELALKHPAVHRAFFTPLWQLGVAVMGCLMLLLLQKAQVKLKSDRDTRLMAKGV